MLYAIIVSVILLIICVWATKKLNEKIENTFKSALFPQEIYELSDFSKLFAVASMIFFGISAGFMFAYGVEASALFRQNIVSALWIALSIITAIIGQKTLKTITIKNYSPFYSGMMVFLIILGCLVCEVSWGESTKTIEETVITKIETLQLDSEIIPNMCIDGEGEVVAFCYITPEGTSEYDTVPADQAHIEYVENGRYMQIQVKSNIITAIYPNEQIETRVSSTEKEYVFYIQKEN